MASEITKLVDLSKQNEEFQNQLKYVFENVVQKTLSEWAEILTKEEYLIALKTNFFYNHIIKVGTRCYSGDEKRMGEFHALFLENINKDYNNDMKFAHSKEYGFIKIEKDMPTSPFGRSYKNDLSLTMKGDDIVFSRNYSLYNGFGSEIKSFSQSFIYSKTNKELTKVFVGRMDIFNMFGWRNFVEYSIK